MNKPRICILASQYFGWGAYSGFGSMPRKLATGLAAQRVAVTVITQRRRGQSPIETIDGVTVVSYGGLNPGEMYRLVRESDADIFHSQNPSLLTYIAERVHPGRVHLVTCRDPHTRADWMIEFRYATTRRRLLFGFNYFTEGSFVVRHAVRKANGVYVPAQFLRPTVRRIFRLRELPGILPNLTMIPQSPPRKGETPTFVFISRWDKRKRPWLFLDLAAQFPDYRFVAIGESTALGESGYDVSLRRKYQHVPNLEMPGLIDQFKQPERFSRSLSEAWALVNTSAREALPLTFLEAAAHSCALLSGMDPDQWVSRFGRQVRGNDFAQGLRELMADSPLDKGCAAYAYVKGSHHEHSRALAEHIEVYRQFV